jgi:general stress protein 26
MPHQLDPNTHELLQRRLNATLGTENADGSIHLTAVWFLFEENSFYIATSSKTKKARNITGKKKASLMVDLRKPGTERSLTVAATLNFSQAIAQNSSTAAFTAAISAQPRWPILGSSRFSPRSTM